MSDTPRVDMAWAASERDDDHGAIAMHGLAQDLERELAAVTAERDNLIPLLKLALRRLPDEDILRANGTDYLRRIGAFNPLRKDGA